MKKIKTTKDKRWKYIKIDNLKECEELSPKEIDYIIIKHPPKEDEDEWKECDGKNIIEEIRNKYQKKNLWILLIAPDHTCIYNPEKAKAKYIMGSPESVFHHLLQRDWEYSVSLKEKNKTNI